MTVVDTSTVDSVLTITLNDQERRNSLSVQLLRELRAAIDKAEGNDAVRVVVVTNSGTTFCAGANLAERSKSDGAPNEDVVDMSEIFLRIRHSAKPFVGRLAGHCVAGGVGLAAVMDVSVAIDTAKFGFTEVRLGVAPAIISVVCLPKMRLADAQNAFLRGNRFSADEAARMGLITKAVPPAEIDREINAIVSDLLAGEPHALDVAKQLTVSTGSMSEEQAFVWASQTSAGLFQSAEAREGISAYLEKRPASWVKHVPTDNEHRNSSA
ncbi:MAG: enoyl-CoA hydratase/isomerase family protein [Acidimicrobiales bacterium]